MKEQIREIIENNDSLVQYEEDQRMHCILPEHYDELTNEIYQLVSKHQTNSLLIAMLESQLKVEKARMINEHGEVLKNYLTKELERQLEELKG